MSGRPRFLREGQLYCYSCKSFKPADTQHFYVKRTRKKDGIAVFDRRCKDCNIRQNAERYRRNPERSRQAAIRWKTKNPARYRKICRDSAIKSVHGMSRAEYEAKKQAQHGICAMCSRHSDHLVLDHCHATDKTRDFLCDHCNTFLGHIEKNPGLYELAVVYISKHNGGMAFPCPTR